MGLRLALDPGEARREGFLWPFRPALLAKGSEAVQSAFQLLLNFIPALWGWHGDAQLIGQALHAHLGGEGGGIDLGEFSGHQ